MKDNNKEINTIKDNKSEIQTNENDTNDFELFDTMDLEPLVEGEVPKSTIEIDRELHEQINSKTNKASAEDEETEKFSFKAELISWVKILVVCFGIAYLLTTFVVVNAYVPSGSMETTIMTGDRLFANRLEYYFSKPERFDIAVLEFPDDPSQLFVKRVIGLPNDTVEIKEGKLYINEELVDEPYLTEPMKGSFGPYNVPEGCYFVLGDNRNNSDDGRYWQNTYVEEDAMLARIFFRYWPNFDLMLNE